MEKQICRVCGVEKPIGEFTLNGARRRSACKPCEAARVKAYYHGNEEYREKVKATARLRDDPVAWAEHMRKKAEPIVPPETMVCKRCKRELPLDAYNKHPTARFGRNTVCRECKITEGREAVKSGRWPSFMPDNQRTYQLMKRYGITVEQYDELLQKQGGRCALCGTDDPGHFKGKFMVVDHDHKTSEVRGLLCTTCNVWLGNYEELVSRCGEDRLMRYLHPERYGAMAKLVENARAAAEVNERYRKAFG